MKKLVVVIAAFAFASCAEKNPNNNEPFVKERATVNPAPVKEYIAGGDTAQLKVQLFEQKESLNYEVKFSFKEAASEKIITLPNMGIMPKPELKKGANDLSCIIGFYDADSVFMEYRLVNVENGLLGYKHLKEYQVEQPKK
ncbi:MAG: hypothetical protein ACOVP7_00545 [Lacibacter sp.]